RSSDLFFLVFGLLSDKIGRKIIILAGCLIAAVTYLPIYHAMADAANVKRDATGLITGADPNTLLLIGLVWIQVIYVTMVYGPIAAFLVEYFRAKVRYTSLSIPYHFGNGWFGGMLPLLFTALVGATYPEGSKSYVPFLTNFFGLPIKTNWDLRQFNTTNDPNGNPYLGLAYVMTVAVGVEARPRVPRLPAFPVRHEERVADEVDRGEDANGRAEDEERGERIAHGLEPAHASEPTLRAWPRCAASSSSAGRFSSSRS